jgi:hypothetical protein
VLPDCIVNIGASSKTSQWLECQSHLGAAAAEVATHEENARPVCEGIHLSNRARDPELTIGSTKR